MISLNLGDDGERLTKAKLYQDLGKRLVSGDFAGWLSEEISIWERHGPQQTFSTTQRRVVVETQTGSLNNEQVQNVNSALFAAGFIRSYNPEDYKHLYGNAGGKVIIYYNPQDAALGRIVETIVKQPGNFTDVAAPTAKPDLAPGTIYLYLPR